MRVARSAGVLGALAGGGLAYGLWEARQFVLRELRLPGLLPSGAHPLRVLHLADTHLTPPAPGLVDFLAQLAAVEADVVVATGDLLGDVGAEDATIAALAPLTADGTPGLVCLGSNDFYAPTPKSPTLYFSRPAQRVVGQRLDTDRFVRGLSDTGWRVLRNADTTTLAIGDSTVSVGAIDDPHLPDTVIPSVAALAPEASDADLQLGLVHAPYMAALDRLEEAGYRLLLAGHTHGGQVRVPGIGALVANCDIPLDRARGASRHGRATLHVSAGLGHSKYTPVRVACRPEATLLTLLPTAA